MEPSQHSTAITLAPLSAVSWMKLRRDFVPVNAANVQHGKNKGAHG
jgi:hypothetical protein